MAWGFKLINLQRYKKSTWDIKMLEQSFGNNDLQNSFQISLKAHSLMKRNNRIRRGPQSSSNSQCIDRWYHCSDALQRYISTRLTTLIIPNLQLGVMRDGASINMCCILQWKYEQVTSDSGSLSFAFFCLF